MKANFSNLEAGLGIPPTRSRRPVLRSRTAEGGGNEADICAQVRCGIRLLTSAATIFGAALLFVGVTAQGQPKSPIGMWDCVMSGARGGVAYITFFDDKNGGTVDVSEIIVPKAPSSSVSLIAGDIGTNGLGPRVSSNSAPFELFGFDRVSGPWGFDNKGRIIGSFVEVAGADASTVCTTNYDVTTVSGTTVVLVTNLDGSITSWVTNTYLYITNFSNPIIDCVTTVTPGSTNTVNFIGSVVPGKRLALKCASTTGSFTLRGAPVVTLGDISGSWYAIKTQNQVSAFEFLELTPSPFADEPNTYDVEGFGPNYYVNGIGILSARKKIAFTFKIYDLDGFELSTRAVVGSFNGRKFKASTAGVESPGGITVVADRINFQLTRRTTVP